MANKVSNEFQLKYLIFHITGIKDCLNAKRLLLIMHYLMPVVQLFISSSVEACPSLKVLFFMFHNLFILLVTTVITTVTMVHIYSHVVPQDI